MRPEATSVLRVTVRLAEGRDWPRGKGRRQEADFLPYTLFSVSLLTVKSYTGGARAGKRLQELPTGSAANFTAVH
jgi:hypothetical protein